MVSRKLDDEKRIVLMSYMPLVYGMGSVIDNPNVGELSEMILQAIESQDGAAKACLWINTNNGLSPILVYDGADEIADHLMWWCENKPEKWFVVHICDCHDGYKIVLAPDLDQSIARWKYHHDDIQHKHNKEQFMFLALPLRFAAEQSDIYQIIKNNIPTDKIKIGLMDTSNIKNVNDGNVDKYVRWVGQIRVSDISEASAIMAMDYLNDQETQNRNS